MGIYVYLYDVMLYFVKKNAKSSLWGTGRHSLKLLVPFMAFEGVKLMISSKAQQLDQHKPTQIRNGSNKTNKK